MSTLFDGENSIKAPIDKATLLDKETLGFVSVHFIQLDSGRSSRAAGVGVLVRVPTNTTTKELTRGSINDEEEVFIEGFKIPVPLPRVRL